MALRPYTSDGSRTRQQSMEMSLTFRPFSSANVQYTAYSVRSMQISSSGQCTLTAASGHTNQHGGMTRRFATMSGHRSQLGWNGVLGGPSCQRPSLPWHGSSERQSERSLADRIAEGIESAVKGMPSKAAQGLTTEACKTGLTEACKTGLTKALKGIVAGIIRHVAGEAPGEVASKLISTLEGATGKLALKLAGICGLVGGAIVSVVSCLLQIGAYAVKVYRKYDELKRRGGSYKRELGKFVFTETINLLSSCAGAIAASIVSAIVGLLIGGLAGGVAGFVVGAAISLAAFLIGKGLQWIGKKTYDQVMPEVEAASHTTEGTVTRSAGQGAGMVSFYSIEMVCDANNDVLSQIEQRCCFVPHLRL